MDSAFNSFSDGFVVAPLCFAQSTINESDKRHSNIETYVINGFEKKIWLVFFALAALSPLFRFDGIETHSISTCDKYSKRTNHRANDFRCTNDRISA